MSNITNEYLNLKKSYPDHLLFYRMGGFYELYFDDAILAASQLLITLNHKKIAEKSIPACGFPVKSLNIFSNKLLNLGFKIAIAEQFISPNKSQKFHRQVSKILTPGTIINDIEENILLTIAKNNQKLDLCFGNILMGNFYLDQIEESQLNGYLKTINPAEILVFSPHLSPSSSQRKLGSTKELGVEADPSFRWDDDGERWGSGLESFENKITHYSPNPEFKIDNQILKILGKNNNLALKLTLDYITSIHDSSIIKYFKIHQYQSEEFLKISALTARNLQLFDMAKIIDRTSCNMGKRFLQSSIVKPLANIKSIQQRLDVVEFLLKENILQKQLKNHLQNLPDLEKIIGKIAINKNANLDDLSLILQALQNISQIAEILFHQKLSEISRELNVDFGLINLLKSAIAHAQIKEGFNPKLDNFRKLQKEELQKISTLEKAYKVKIEFSEIIGFYFEIKRAKLVNINIPKEFQIIQNLDKSVRFSSNALKNHQLVIADLKNKIKALEEKIAQELTNKVLENFTEIKNSCKAIGLLDLLLSFAILAKENNYVKPVITRLHQIKIDDGKHLISNQFTPNDCNFDKKIWLITGANMAGKSTFLKQNALIIILAQMGCFVPAKATQIGIRKEIFAKTSSADNLQKGKSSFMAEMLEIAQILKKADENSLIIIDEICQATNSNEGLEIAENIIKHIHNHNKSLALISTHHLNLPQKCQNLENIICKKIDKTHRIEDGIAKSSSAADIARQAGLDFIINN